MDAKSELSQYCQRNRLRYPAYVYTQETSLQNQSVWHARVRIVDSVTHSASSSIAHPTKAGAAQDAARNLLNILSTPSASSASSTSSVSSHETKEMNHLTPERFRDLLIDSFRAANFPPPIVTLRTVEDVSTSEESDNTEDVIQPPSEEKRPVQILSSSGDLSEPHLTFHCDILSSLFLNHLRNNVEGKSVEISTDEDLISANAHVALIMKPRTAGIVYSVIRSPTGAEKVRYYFPLRNVKIIQSIVLMNIVMECGAGTCAVIDPDLRPDRDRTFAYIQE